MLEDVIKTKEVCGKTVSILLYSVDKENREFEDNHRQYYEVRVSENDEQDNFYTDSEFYLKRDAVRTLNIVCKELEIEHIKELSRKETNAKRHEEDSKPINVLDSVTGKTFAFANSYDKREFFDIWDKLVVDVLDREDEG